MLEEFSKLKVNDEYYCGGDYANKEMLVAEITDFLSTKIQEAVEEERERVVGIIKEKHFYLTKKGEKEKLGLYEVLTPEEREYYILGVDNFRADILSSLDINR